MLNYGHVLDDRADAAAGFLNDQLRCEIPAELVVNPVDVQEVI